MYMRGRFSYIAGEWIILKPIYHAGQIISAYETVMGLPAAERLTGSDGTFKPEARPAAHRRGAQKGPGSSRAPNGLGWLD